MRTVTHNAGYTKEYNRKQVLGLLLGGSLSRAELARRTGLTRAAISVIADELLGEGLVEERAREGAASAKGRSPTPLALRPGSVCAVGVYLCRDGCRMGLVDLQGEVSCPRALAPEEIRCPETALERIAALAGEILEEGGVAPGRLLGLGVSCPGPVDAAAGRLLDPPGFEAWHHARVADVLTRRTGLDTRLENNAYSLALSEKSYGNARDLEEYMLLLVDTGVGSGLISRGRLFAGAHGFSGEIGHTSIRFDGERCSCGNRGCFELYASIPNLLRGFGLPYAAWGETVRRARAGEPEAAAVLQREAAILAVGILNAATFLDMEAVLLDGDLLEAFDLLRGPIEQTVNGTGLARSYGRIRILPASGGDHHRVRAAANIQFNRFLTPGIGG